MTQFDQMKKSDAQPQTEFTPVDLDATPDWWRVFEPNGGRAFECADLYCGCGGGTHSVIKAILKRRGYIRHMVAVNHWSEAIRVHTANYPGVAHFTDKVENIDPKVAIPWGHLDMLTAGIKCTHFSMAAGGVPRSEQERMDAFQVLRWLADLDVSRLVIENVAEFTDWGPLNESGRPIEKQRGRMFQAWLDQLRAMNYKVEWRILTACWYGDPTSRERFWLIAKKGNRKIFFPGPTHRDPNKPADMFNADLPTWPVARDIIDFGLPTKSIFGSDLVPNTLARIMAGMEKFVGLKMEIADLPGCPLFRPQPKKAGARVSPYAEAAHRLHYLNMAIRAVRGEKLYEKNKKIVRRVSPAAIEVVKRALRIGGTQVADQNAGAFAIKLYGTSTVESIDAPVPGLTAQGNHIGFVMVNRGSNDGYERIRSMSEPLPGQTARNSIGIVDFVLGQQSQAAPRSVDAELPTIATDGAIRMISIVLPPEGIHRGNIARSIDSEIQTLTQRGGGSLISFLVSGEHVGNGERVASIEKSFLTLTQTPDWAIAGAFLTSYHGSESGHDRTASIDKALPTIDTRNRFLSAFLATYYGTEKDGQSVDEALRTVKTRDSFLLIVPGIGLMDIRYRMLVLKELMRAHSFPKEFVFACSNDDGKKMVGNSWPIGMGTAIVESALAEQSEIGG